MNIETQAVVKTLKGWALGILAVVAMWASVTYVRTEILLAIIGVYLLGYFIYYTYRVNLARLKDDEREDSHEKFMDRLRKEQQDDELKQSFESFESYLNQLKKTD